MLKDDARDRSARAALGGWGCALGAWMDGWIGLVGEVWHTLRNFITQLPHRIFCFQLKFKHATLKVSW
jgi:hypothetical protein